MSGRTQVSALDASVSDRLVRARQTFTRPLPFPETFNAGAPVDPASGRPISRTLS